MPMRCSECRKPVKPVVALDIDGTLGDYHGHFIDFARKYLGCALPGHTLYDGSIPFWQFLELDLPLYREVKLAYRQGGTKRTMPVYDGASQLSHALRKAGAEIWIATTRPHLRLDNVDPDTREWLRRNDVVYDHMIYGDDKYRQLIDLVAHERIVGVIDDLPEQLEDAHERKLEALMRKNHHNAHARDQATNHFGGYRGFELVHDLWDAQAVLVGRVLDWLDANNTHD